MLAQILIQLPASLCLATSALQCPVKFGLPSTSVASSLIATNPELYPSLTPVSLASPNTPALSLSLLLFSNMESSQSPPLIHCGTCYPSLHVHLGCPPARLSSSSRRRQRTSGALHPLAPPPTSKIPPLGNVLTHCRDQFIFMPCSIRLRLVLGP